MDLLALQQNLSHGPAACVIDNSRPARVDELFFKKPTPRKKKADRH